MRGSKSDLQLSTEDDNVMMTCFPMSLISLPSWWTIFFFTMCIEPCTSLCIVFRGIQHHIRYGIPSSFEISPMFLIEQKTNMNIISVWRASHSNCVWFQSFLNRWPSGLEWSPRPCSSHSGRYFIQISTQNSFFQLVYFSSTILSFLWIIYV